MNLEPDDPRMKWVWRFTIQTEEVDDGTWRAWYPSGGWSVTAPSEKEAKEKANQEGIRLREDPDEIARRVATMRRHLVEPVPGVSKFDKSVLESAWDSDDPAKAVRAVLGNLGDEPPRG
jgi:hypothetical protein